TAPPPCLRGGAGCPCPRAHELDLSRRRRRRLAPPCQPELPKGDRCAHRLAARAAAHLAPQRAHCPPSRVRPPLRRSLDLNPPARRQSEPRLRRWRQATALAFSRPPSHPRPPWRCRADVRPPDD